MRDDLLNDLRELSLKIAQETGEEVAAVFRRLTIGVDPTGKRPVKPQVLKDQAWKLWETYPRLRRDKILLRLYAAHGTRGIDWNDEPLVDLMVDDTLTTKPVAV